MLMTISRWLVAGCTLEEIPTTLKLSCLCQVDFIWLETEDEEGWTLRMRSENKPSNTQQGAQALEVTVKAPGRKGKWDLLF